MSSLNDSSGPRGGTEEQPPKQPVLGTVFMGPNGLRAGWRISIYVVILIALGFAIREIVRHVPLVHKVTVGSNGVLAPIGLIISEVIVAFTVLFAAWIMSLIEKRNFGAYGTPLAEILGKRFWQGIVWGLVMVTFLVGLIAAVGAYSFGSLALSQTGLLRNGMLWLVGFFLVGVFEEFAFRGYLQYTLGSGIGFWASAVILSMAFGAIHLGNPGEGIVGGLSVVTIALFFCLTLRRTGNLWFAIGLHCSFDWGETFLYSVPNSGTTTAGALSHASLHGARWITGGTIGPEGSVFCFLMIALAFLAFDKLYPAKHA